MLSLEQAEAFAAAFSPERLASAMARIEKVRPHYAGDNEAFIAAVEHELVQIANEIEAARRAGDVVRRKILNRLIEACRTDEICKTSGEGPRRYDP